MKHTLITLAACVAAVACTALTAYAAEGGAGTGPSFKGPVGLQLYSLRGEFLRNVPATLDKVKALGFKYVETAGTYNFTPEKFKEMLDERGLVPVGGHFPYARYKTDVEGIAREAKALGLKYVGCAWIDHSAPFDEKACRDAINVFNTAGEALQKHGLKFFYHIHGYEFHPYGDGTLFDLLMKETKPEWVSYQMDVFWTVHPGQDPAALLKKYGSRWALMHVKDMRKGTKGDLSGGSDVKNDVTVGTGVVDWPKVMKAAQEAGVKWYIIEDESPTVLEQIPGSLKYLESLRF